MFWKGFCEPNPHMLKEDIRYVIEVFIGEEPYHVENVVLLNLWIDSNVMIC